MTAATRSFVPPTAHARQLAVGSLVGLDSVLQRAFDPGNTAAFRPMGAPASGDWLDEHPESGQTFTQYRDKFMQKPSRSQRTIRFLPVGDFLPRQSPPLQVLSEFCSAFYYGMTIDIATPVSLSVVHATTRINSYTHNRQVLVGDLLRYARTAMRGTSGVFCSVCITMEDLYPRPSWNFVFGQASLTDRVGAFSFARYSPAFPDRPREMDEAALRVMLRRSCLVLVHEVGHIFGMQHCIFFNCVMNGSNSLEESTARSSHLCPVCLRKLCEALQCHPLPRYHALAAFFDRYGWADELAWTRARIAELDAAEPSTAAAGSGGTAAAPGAGRGSTHRQQVAPPRS